MSAFGTVFMPEMAVASFNNGDWTDTKLVSAEWHKAVGC